MVGDIDAKASLGELLMTLRENGVTKYRDTGLGLEIEFGDHARLLSPMQANTSEQDAAPKNASNAPEELDDELLYHSAP